VCVGGKDVGVFSLPLRERTTAEKKVVGSLDFFFLRLSLRPKNKALALEGAQEKTHAPGLLLAHSPPFFSKGYRPLMAFSSRAVSAPSRGGQVRKRAAEIQTRREMPSQKKSPDDSWLSFALRRVAPSWQPWPMFPSPPRPLTFRTCS